MKQTEMLEGAKEVLKYNDVGEWTRPAPDLYPHQWLWDSCFVAIGLSHYDVTRAQKEITSIFRGQWSNGMVPNMVFGEEKNFQSAKIWDSKGSIYAPVEYNTSGITQPPMLAEAVVRIGEKLGEKERRAWYSSVWKNLLDYHSWLYTDRDPHAEGLAVLVHPWETGMDNTPPWMAMLREHQMPLWIKLVDKVQIDKIIEKLRRDTRQVPPDERMSTLESLMLFHVVRRLRRKHYDTSRLLVHSHFLIEDLFFNAILVRANTHLKAIAKEINETIPRPLLSSINKADSALEQLWDEESQMYYSRLFVTRKLVKMPTIATMLPLYSGTISKKRADHLVGMLKNDELFSANYPVPSVPLNSPFFNHRRYWQGPTWMNTNWLIIDGLRRYGYETEAEQLKLRTLQMVERSGFSEYFSPVDGYGAGISPFSWTAALTIDLLQDKTK